MSTESYLRQIILKWKCFWMNKYGDRKADHDNYFSRAFNIDANMQVSLARMLNEDFKKQKDFSIELCNEYLKMKAELDEAREVIGFYVDKDSWTNLEENEDIYERSMIVIRDEMENEGYLTGGKRAREFLSKHPVRSGE